MNYTFLRIWLCRIGIHKWEDCPSFQGLYFRGYRISDKVCSVCGKKNLKKTKFSGKK